MHKVFRTFSTSAVTPKNWREIIISELTDILPPNTFSLKNFFHKRDTSPPRGTFRSTPDIFQTTEKIGYVIHWLESPSQAIKILSFSLAPHLDQIFYWVTLSSRHKQRIYFLTCDLGIHKYIPQKFSKRSPFVKICIKHFNDTEKVQKNTFFNQLQQHHEVHSCFIRIEFEWSFHDNLNLRYSGSK